MNNAHERKPADRLPDCHYSCQPARPLAESSIQEFIQQQLPGAELSYNSSKDFVLCVSSATEPATGRKQYQVVKVAERTIIIKGYFMPGYIRWLNDNELELFDAPGIVAGSDSDKMNKKIINIRTPKF
ncbi:hypothetical protein QQ054_06465 [Oscillatoria amoena NRMC-F 0135]|nr:hypothetical protein [Oscillatoria amoena NRMC-F 0135]